MIKNECRHEWEINSHVGAGGAPSTHVCKKCHAHMTSAEVIQLETLLYLQGFQKYTGIVALIISFFALLVSLHSTSGCG